MTKTFDEIMKVLDEDGTISDGQAQALIDTHGPITPEEKRKIAAALRMQSASGPRVPDEGESEAGEAPAAVTFEDYLLALSVLDSSDTTELEKQDAQRVKDAYENQS